MTKVLVFDFDGVIIPGSERIKQSAWETAFRNRGQPFLSHLDEGKRKYAGRGDRYDILTHVHHQMGYSFVRAREMAIGDADIFARTVSEGIRALGVSAATARDLRALSECMPQYINSATPTRELVGRAHGFGIADCFSDILGSDNSKVRNLEIILERERVLPTEVLFVGDSESDWNAADISGCRFLGFANESNQWLEQAQPFPVVNSIAEVRDHL